MPGYVHKQLIQYEHDARWQQDCPLGSCGNDYQKPVPINTSVPLNADGNKFIQQVVDSFLYYGIAVNLTILHALSDITCTQANPIL